MEPDALAVDLQRVTVDDAGVPGDVGPGERRQEQQRQGDQVTGHIPGIVTPGGPKEMPRRSGAS